MPLFFTQLVSPSAHSHLGYAQRIPSRNSFDTHCCTQFHCTGYAQGCSNGHSDVGPQFSLRLHRFHCRHRSLQHPQDTFLGPSNTRTFNLVWPSTLDYPRFYSASGCCCLLDRYHDVRSIAVSTKMAKGRILLGTVVPSPTKSYLLEAFFFSSSFTCHRTLGPILFTILDPRDHCHPLPVFV